MRPLAPMETRNADLWRKLRNLPLTADTPRFWNKVIKSTGCWMWTGAKQGSGYGQFYIGGKKEIVHRLAWFIFMGSIPEGMTLDHLCRVRLCVNPDHLEIVTNKENILRGTSPSAIAARKTHCKRGHLLTGENLHIRVGIGRQCRTCKRMTDHKHEERRAEKKP